MITLDGENKLIILDTDSTFDVHDIYVASVDWAVLDNDMKYLLPMDYISPDFRLLNGWKLSASGYLSGSVITINGSLATDDSSSRVAPGQNVEWDLNKAIYTIMLPVGSGLSTEEHDKLFENNVNIKKLPAKIQNAGVLKGIV